MAKKTRAHKRSHIKKAAKRKAGRNFFATLGSRSKFAAAVIASVLLATVSLAYWNTQDKQLTPASVSSSEATKKPSVKNVSTLSPSELADIPPEAFHPQPRMPGGYNASSRQLPPGALPPGVTLPGMSGGRTTGQGYGTYDGVRQQFTGKERDNETGLDYFGARYYSSVQGRFTSPDEFSGGPQEVYTLGKGDPEKQALPYADITNPQSLNKYSYAYNNPLRFVDPDGHQGEESWMSRLLRWFVRKSDPQQDAEQERRGPLSLDADKVTAQTSQEIAKNTLTVGEWAERFGLDFGALNAGRQIAKGSKTGAALAGVMIAVNVVSLGKGEQGVVLGESMESRVIPVAEKLGAGTYGGRAIIEENVRWVESQIGKGRQFSTSGLTQ